MKAYAARLKADQSSPREVVGFFLVNDLEELRAMIDGCCDVGTREVMELGPGGIYWDDGAGYVLPPPEDENLPGFPEDATLTESWMALLCFEGKWELIPSAGLSHANDW